MRIGIHTSISGGFGKAVQHLVELGCNACQMFSRSPRGGKARDLKEDEVTTFRELCSANDINPVAVHIPYVLNLATSDPDMHRYAAQMVREDMERADALGAAYLVLHMGSHKGKGIDEGLSQVARALTSALQQYRGKTVLLLENTSGAGTEVGFLFEHLAAVLEMLEIDNTGICFDTCHGFAAGYDLATGEKVHETLSQFDSIIGIDKLRLIHANDAMFPLGSTRDRHADIGAGYIGENGFRAILGHPLLKDKPFILETPAAGDDDWKRNIDVLKALSNGNN
ncbi:deoxyribonuclease IV [Phosphitispora fastidiosa]|uniref:deoxyribonuclease IV n=1 Tax=Phosphitispora fastidiosa TaxID=2837202 RepID=UPI001E2F0534|nr:deoxyribonuclease IV [Phosphitispora fastidiosa]MBU7005581.1 deoxyribonuclease-4 [Phosphitispora fastidiosa]